jgi:type IV secretion system protein VirB9
MKYTVSGILIILTCFCGVGVAQQRSAGKHSTAPSRPATSGPAPDVKSDAAPDTEPRAKVVQYQKNDIVKVNAKIRYSVLIVLPANERILDFTCGDKDYWVISGAQNLAYVKPAKVGSQTNLNLVTASGNIFSFLLTEISELPGAVPDLKIDVETNDDMSVTASAPPKFVSAQEMEDYRQQIEIAKDETRRTKESTQKAIDKGISQFVSNVRFPYRFEAGRKPFLVRAMYNDDKFTYLQARPEETPAIYEIKDGKPNLINFRYENGVYVVEKILDDGYLAIGKRKLKFKREN